MLNDAFKLSTPGNINTEELNNHRTLLNLDQNDFRKSALQLLVVQSLSEHTEYNRLWGYQFSPYCTHFRNTTAY